MGPRNAVLVGEPHANCATGTSGGAPSGATKRCFGWGETHAVPPLGPWVELPETGWGKRMRCRHLIRTLLRMAVMGSTRALLMATRLGNI